MTDKEERLAELRKKYAVETRKGNHDAAYEAVKEARRLKGEEKSSDSSDGGEESDAAVDDFESLDGVGPELAEELAEQFETVEDVLEADPEDLEPIPGIGKKRAESLTGG